MEIYKRSLSESKRSKRKIPKFQKNVREIWGNCMENVKQI